MFNRKKNVFPRLINLQIGSEFAFMLQIEFFFNLQAVDLSIMLTQ